MNVLLTSVGRRSYLVEYFKEAIGSDYLVIAANSEPLTSGMLAADKAYTVPPVNSPEYIARILEICTVEKIGLVLSLFDIDLPYLANARAHFEKAGINLVVSDPWVIDIANDKWKTWTYLNQNGVSTPRTYLNVEDVRAEIKCGNLCFPLIVKPRWGMGSLSIFRVDDLTELSFFYEYALKQIKKSYLNILSMDELEKSVVIQEFIEGKEFGLDVFNDLKGSHVQTVAKQKLAMRAGETDMAVVVDDPRLFKLGQTISALFEHRGNMDVDILENESGDLFVLEMNARFGGGYPFSHVAGADFPAALLLLAKSGLVNPRSITSGCVSLKAINILKVRD